MKTLTLWLTRDIDFVYCLWPYGATLRYLESGLWEEAGKGCINAVAEGVTLPEAAQLLSGEGPVKCELRIGVDDEPGTMGYTAQPCPSHNMRSRTMSYAAHSDFRDEQQARGHKAWKCPDCGRWLYKCEM